MTRANMYGADFYDRVHAQGNRPETRALYRPLFSEVAAAIRARGSRSILEVGCGNGFLAEFLLRQYGGQYRGFDFSPVAIRNSRDRSRRPELFFQADAREARSYAGTYDTIVCTEVLEHIDADLDVIRYWPSGVWCVCSVPNFDFDSHVRFFRTTAEVTSRYGRLIDIAGVSRIARPIIPDGRLRTYLRNLRWSRGDLSMFMGFLGIQTFDRLGGWFLFSGIKK